VVRLPPPLIFILATMPCERAAALFPIWDC
jgi:hypothetical protein